MDKSIINKMFKSYSPRFKPWAMEINTIKQNRSNGLTIINEN